MSRIAKINAGIREEFSPRNDDPRREEVYAQLIDLDFDDSPTTPGEMRWVDCPCKDNHFMQTVCDICKGTGQMLTMVRDMGRKTA